MNMEQMTTATTNGLAIIQNSAEIIKQAPDVLAKHEASRAAAEKAAGEILARINASGMNADLDAEAMSIIVKLAKTAARMKDDRAPITQIFDEIKKRFTEAENAIDPKKAGTTGAALQALRDAYAAEVLRKQEEEKREAERRIAEEAGIAKTRAITLELIAEAWLNNIEARKARMMAAFNAITLENYEQRAAALREMDAAPTQKEIDVTSHNIRVINNGRYNPVGNAVGGDQMIAIAGETADAYRASEQLRADVARYVGEIATLRDELIQRLPGLKQELEEIAAAKRAADEAAAAATAANDEAAAQRAREAQIEAQRLAEEKQRREEERQRADEAAAAKAREEAAAKADMAKAAAATAALFAVDAPTPVAEAPETRTTFEIEVTAAAGWAEIFQFFYMKNVGAMSVEEFGKKTLNQMKKFAEDTAKKTGEKIASKALVYVTAVKAVNRKN